MSLTGHSLHEVAINADLDITDHLPPPPEVIEIDNDNDVVFITYPDFDISPPPTPNKSPKIEPDSTQVTTMLSTHSTTPKHCQPCHLDNYHLFTTVADKLRQPPEHPYRKQVAQKLIFLFKMKYSWRTCAIM